MSNLSVNATCGKMVGAYELDERYNSKELVVLSNNCKVEEGTFLGGDRTVSNIEIISIDPKTGKMTQKAVVYTLPKGEAFARRQIRVADYIVDDKAVMVKDMNNDGKLDIVVSTFTAPQKGTIAQQNITILYNYGYGRFETVMPQRTEKLMPERQ